MYRSKFLNAYYFFKPVIPRRLQILLRRRIVSRKLSLCRDIWPIDEESSRQPRGWPGWPGKRKFSLVLTHDVDTARGQARCRPLMELEKELGFRSSFNFVPERYPVSPQLRFLLAKNGFEIGVHGLYHDGKYFRSREIFEKRAIRINAYLEKWQSVGFRSPSMLHNLEWMHLLNIEYDSSTFDTDPFEPQPQGVRSIFPLWIPGSAYPHGFVELPYTLPQDFTLFVIMKEKGIDIWKRKLDWIAKHGGMALLNTHPDYIHFEGKRQGAEEYPVDYYRYFLEYIKAVYEDSYWHVLPREMARFWSEYLQKNSLLENTTGLSDSTMSVVAGLE
ncbi:MAG: hypothetical protein ACE14T_05200 [Syntrophales bacterium]